MNEHGSLGTEMRAGKGGPFIYITVNHFNQGRIGDPFNFNPFTLEIILFFRELYGLYQPFQSAINQSTAYPEFVYILIHNKIVIGRANRLISEKTWRNRDLLIASNRKTH